MNNLNNSLIITHLNILLFLTLLLLFSCRKDIDKAKVNECLNEITILSESVFSQDAQQISYAYIREDSNNINYSKPALDIEYTKYYMGKLSAIYNYASEPNSNLYEMVFKYKIYKTENTKLDQLSIWFTPGDLTIRNQFINSPGKTDNKELNELYDNYEFTTITEEWTPKILYVKSKNNYNVGALADKLTGTLGIDKVYTKNVGNGNLPKIRVEQFENFEQFIFIKTWYHQITGDKYQHFWKVKVHKNCNVELVLEYGDELPY